MKTPDDPDIEPSALGIPIEPRRRQFESPALFRGRREIVILHQGTEYRLRITKGNKLILTK